ncbi:MAG: GNAT family N-acetyltransferase [Chloroflexi bacterium]|nr:MAG: GNAT family N-acetyltransferase [Chloroflexota bacterium]
MAMPVLETERLRVRVFQMDDLDTIHCILNEAFQTDVTLEGRREWLQWSILNETQLSELRQPPYGDRAIVLKRSGELIGSVGYVPLLAPFGQLPGLGAEPGSYFTEFGMFWAIDQAHRRHGYAGEAARAMIAYAFEHLHLARILAMTDYTNTASQAVMRQLGMRLLRNPLPEPPWLQVVGVINNPSL